ncbi:MAG: hypothetical protein NDJ92_12135 [Thermoanaerobaculia bacterium]|nr:hypothetical protein [Thermoanaerobaculia bacterium]
MTSPPSAVPPSSDALREALQVSEDLLRDLELGESSLSGLVLRAVRLARLVNDSEHEQMFNLEASGYPSTPQGIPQPAWSLALKANRGYQELDAKTKELKQFAYTDSIDEIEQELQACKLRLQAAGNVPISSSGSNNPFTPAPHMAQIQERERIVQNIRKLTERRAERRTLLHQFALRVHYELKFSGIASDVFARLRERVDRAVGSTVPHSVKRFAAVYENLTSDNPEDWSNAVHSCRRILQDLADVLYPPREDRVIEKDGRKKVVKLGPDNYVNRLAAFAEERSESARFEAIVGSNLDYLGDRLDATFQAAQKGSHSTIVSREEADRYVVYTYLLVGDLLSLAGQV